MIYYVLLRPYSLFGFYFPSSYLSEIRLFQKMLIRTLKENHNFLLHKRLKPIRIIDLSLYTY